MESDGRAERASLWTWAVMGGQGVQDVDVEVKGMVSGQDLDVEVERRGRWLAVDIDFRVRGRQGRVPSCEG